MLAPRRLKHRKQFKPKLEGISYRGNALSFGDFGLRSEQTGKISSRQIEAARRAITHYIKRGGRVWIRIFPDRPITRKPPETRMGGGKGDFYEFVTPVKVGRIIFEMSGVSEDIARQALRLAAYKLPLKSSFMKKGEL
ncbi:MAG: 50S ribosomal protein L16 [Candidatus Levybacteria bacterium RIFCSPHIGHO2_01_FULL_36_15]|nr:MAG: 50S ribosomal protein L16 [Candidatus Levybacteria bacterium RIFCSPHIGHO2_01_FULL_36_15]